MRVVLQRVARASVRVGDETVGEIGHGFLLLVGVGIGDAGDEEKRLAEKVFHLRGFEDDRGKMNLALSDVGGEILVVPEFTLYGEVGRGRRPSWAAAAPPPGAAGGGEAVGPGPAGLGAAGAPGG